MAPIGIAPLSVILPSLASDKAGVLESVDGEEFTDKATVGEVD